MTRLMAVLGLVAASVLLASCDLPGSTTTDTTSTGTTIDSTASTGAVVDTDSGATSAE